MYFKQMRNQNLGHFQHVQTCKLKEASQRVPDIVKVQNKKWSISLQVPTSASLSLGGAAFVNRIKQVVAKSFLLPVQTVHWQLISGGV